jgi:hypothetical protein
VTNHHIIQQGSLNLQGIMNWLLSSTTLLSTPPTSKTANSLGLNKLFNMLKYASLAAGKAKQKDGSIILHLS